MEFIRENILKIITFIVILVIAIIIFTLVFSHKKISNPKTYSDMENYLVQSAKEYVNDNKKLLPNNEKESNKIKLDTLINEGYMEELTAIEDENIKCSGYVTINYAIGNYLFVPFLQCGKHYETETIANHIIDNEKIVNIDDGLYKSGEKYIFRGENPNNYLKLSENMYRIMEIEGNYLKLISVEGINDYVYWDDRYNHEQDEYIGINDYKKSRLKEYFQEIIDIQSVGSKDEKYFSDLEYSKFSYHDICIGKRPSSYSNIDDSYECQITDADQKISLINISDFAKASIDPNCNSIYERSCLNYNYLASVNSSFMTITAASDNTYQIYVIDDGIAELENANDTDDLNIVIYLNETSLYNSGNGSLNDPYTIR